MVDWKVKVVKKDGKEQYFVKPVFDKSAKGNVWIKAVEEIDWTRNNGYSFIGKFLPWWMYSPVQNGQVVLFVDKSSEEAQIYQFKDGKMKLIGRYDRSAFKELRKKIHDLLSGSEVKEEEQVQKVPVEEVEKLIVEFDVEKTVQRDYGYSEKFLSYMGKRTKYKAILKDSQLIAIVSRGFYLLENEKLYDILKKYGEQKGYIVDIISQSLSRIHIKVQPSGSRYAVVVHNSVDASMALRADLLIQVKDGIYTVFRVRDNITHIYKKHTKNMLNFIQELNIIEQILKKSQEYDMFIDRLGEYKISDYEQDIRDMVEAVFPKKHWEPVWFDYKRGRIKTLKDMYQAFAEKIWRDTRLDFKTKVDRFDKMNQMFFVLVGFDVE